MPFTLRLTKQSSMLWVVTKLVFTILSLLLPVALLLLLPVTRS
jgi:hypothetical protein